EEIVELALDGSRRPLRLSPKPLVLQAESTQLEAIVEHLHDLAQQTGITRLQSPWLPPLPDRITLDELRLADVDLRNEERDPKSKIQNPKSEGWDGYTWK